MRTLLAFILVSIVVLGVGPWFVIPALTGQSLDHVSSVVLEWCQLFFFASLGVILVFIGLRECVNRIRTNREFALLHLIEGITAKELTTRSMEDELREIIRERDEIVKDRFDLLAEKADVIDIDEQLTRDAFFEQIAETMSSQLDIPAQAVLKKLLEREDQCTTALTPFLAIPHIIIEGEQKFSLLIARCKDGIYFSEDDPEVKAVFVLAGTMDERQFHLRSLAALAGIVQDPHFEEKWVSAKDRHALRDILLLGKRKRFPKSGVK